MRYLLIVFFHVLISITVFSQYSTMFNDTLRPFGSGAYVFKNTIQDSNHFYISGTVNSAIGQYPFILKLDNYGHIEMKRLFTDTIYGYALFPFNSMVMENKELIFCGQYKNTQGTFGFITSVNKYTFDTSWTKTYLHPDTSLATQPNSGQFSEITALKVTPDGGYILTGNYNKNCITGNLRSFLMKIDSVGNVEWRRTYNSYYSFFDFEVAPDSGYFVPSGFNGTNALQLVKFDKNGLYEWKVGVTTNNMAGYPMTIAIQDSSHVILSFYHLYDVANYRTAVIATKVNTQTRSVDWENDYYPYQNFECISLHQAMGVETLSDGSIIISGTSARYGYDAVILKLNSNGDSLWCKSYDFEPDPYDCQLNDLIVCDDGGFMGVGFFSDQAGPGWTAWMFKTDSNGVVGFEPKASAFDRLRLQVFPNPAQDYTIIKLQKPITEESTLLVYNSLGQKVRSMKIAKNQKQVRLDLLGLESGNYHIVVKTNDRSLYTEKLIIAR